MNHFDRVPNEIVAMILSEVDGYTANTVNKVCYRFRCLMTALKYRMKPFEFEEVTISPSLPNNEWPNVEPRNCVITVITGSPSFIHALIYVEESEDADGTIKFEIGPTYGAMYRCYTVYVKNATEGVLDVLGILLSESFVSKLKFINMPFIAPFIGLLASKFDHMKCTVRKLSLVRINLRLGYSSFGRLLANIAPTSIELSHVLIPRDFMYPDDQHSFIQKALQIYEELRGIPRSLDSTV